MKFYALDILFWVIGKVQGMIDYAKVLILIKLEFYSLFGNQNKLGKSCNIFDGAALFVTHRLLFITCRSMS